MPWLRNVKQWTGIRDIQTLIHTSTDRQSKHPLMDRPRKKKNQNILLVSERQVSMVFSFLNKSCTKIFVHIPLSAFMKYLVMITFNASFFTDC